VEVPPFQGLLRAHDLQEHVRLLQRRWSAPAAALSGNRLFGSTGYVFLRHGKTMIPRRLQSPKSFLNTGLVSLAANCGLATMSLALPVCAASAQERIADGLDAEEDVRLQRAIDPDSAEALATEPIDPQLPTTNARSIFLREEFDRFAPRNALDMARQVPGFTIRGSSGARGLGQADANVIINGRRISARPMARSKPCNGSSPTMSCGSNWSMGRA
jgi:hypothetical protein